MDKSVYVVLSEVTLHLHSDTLRPHLAHLMYASVHSSVYAIASCLIVCSIGLTGFGPLLAGRRSST